MFIKIINGLCIYVCVYCVYILDAKRELYPFLRFNILEVYCHIHRKPKMVTLSNEMLTLHVPFTQINKQLTKRNKYMNLSLSIEK